MKNSHSYYTWCWKLTPWTFFIAFLFDNFFERLKLWGKFRAKLAWSWKYLARPFLLQFFCDNFSQKWYNLPLMSWQIFLAFLAFNFSREISCILITRKKFLARNRAMYSWASGSCGANAKWMTVFLLPLHPKMEKNAQNNNCINIKRPWR